MTKISIDVDFNKDPEAILREIQEKARSEVEKREKKELVASHLENLHHKVNDSVGTTFSNANELIRALASFATPSLRERIIGVTSTGRRKTISMTQQLFDQIKSGLTQGNVSKAQLARDAGVSAAQVRKVEHGGYEAKFGGSSAPSLASSDSSPSHDDQPAVLDSTSEEDAPESGAHSDSFAEDADNQESQDSAPVESDVSDSFEDALSDSSEPLPEPTFQEPGETYVAPEPLSPYGGDAFESEEHAVDPSTPSDAPSFTDHSLTDQPEPEESEPSGITETDPSVSSPDYPAPLSPTEEEPTNPSTHEASDIEKPKPVLKVGKGKYSQQVTRPPISRESDLEQ